MDQTQSRRGRPPRITHDQIAQAVIDVGFPNLTFAAVREKLGWVKAPSTGMPPTVTSLYEWA